MQLKEMQVDNSSVLLQGRPAGRRSSWALGCPQQAGVCQNFSCGTWHGRPAQALPRAGSSILLRARGPAGSCGVPGCVTRPRSTQRSAAAPWPGTGACAEAVPARPVGFAADAAVGQGPAGFW